MSSDQDKLFDLEGQVIVITGGHGQLGRQFSLSLLKRGARVAILDIASDSERAEDAVLSAYQDRYVELPCDITKRSDLQRALEEVTSRWDVPSGLINNAALDSPPGSPAEENGPFENYPEASWEAVMDVNVKGVFLACQVIGGAMAERRRGSVINVASIYGLVSPDQRMYAYQAEAGQPFFKPVAYSASKASILNLTRYLATYWAPRGIRVNTITFGGVFNDQDSRFLKEYEKRVPLGRMAREDEYNGAIVFLLSSASSYMTGSNLVIDGGWTAW